MKVLNTLLSVVSILAFLFGMIVKAKDIFFFLNQDNCTHVVPCIWTNDMNRNIFLMVY